jgi:hypothetical protein
MRISSDSKNLYCLESSLDPNSGPKLERKRIYLGHIDLTSINKDPNANPYRIAEA